MLNTSNNHYEGLSHNGVVIINDTGIVKFIEISEPKILKDTEEILRLIQAFQFSEKYSVVCQSNWKPGRKGVCRIYLIYKDKSY